MKEEKPKKEEDKVPPVNLWSYPMFLNYVLVKGKTSLYTIKK